MKEHPLCQKGQALLPLPLVDLLLLLKLENKKNVVIKETMNQKRKNN